MTFCVYSWDKLCVGEWDTVVGVVVISGIMINFVERNGGAGLPMWWLASVLRPSLAYGI